VRSSLMKVNMKAGNMKSSRIIVHTFVVQNDSQHWNLVSLTDPINTSWHTEEECSIPNNLNDELSFALSIFILACKLDT
jgi:hypothetical protein